LSLTGVLLIIYQDLLKGLGLLKKKRSKTYVVTHPIQSPPPLQFSSTKPSMFDGVVHPRFQYVGEYKPNRRSDIKNVGHRFMQRKSWKSLI